MKKLIGTLRIVTCLFMARTFGHYEYGGWNGDCEYVRYRWRGQSWMIPIGECDE